MPYDPHTISIEAELSALAEHIPEDVGLHTMMLGSALVGSPRHLNPGASWGQRSRAQPFASIITNRGFRPYEE